MNRYWFAWQELKPYKYMAEDESYLETDQESYVRTDDDEEGGGTDWEDSAKRWVNRWTISQNNLF